MIEGSGVGRIGSVLEECVIEQRLGDPLLFVSNSPDGLMSVCLSGYAVVPLEDLLDDAFVERLKQMAIEYVER